MEKRHRNRWRNRATAPTNLELPEGSGLGLALRFRPGKRVGSGPTCGIEIDRNMLHEVICKVMLQLETSGLLIVVRAYITRKRRYVDGCPTWQMLLPAVLQCGHEKVTQITGDVLRFVTQITHSQAFRA